MISFVCVCVRACLRRLGEDDANTTSFLNYNYCQMQYFIAAPHLKSAHTRRLCNIRSKVPNFCFCVSSTQRRLQCVGFRGRVLSASLHLRCSKDTFGPSYCAYLSVKMTHSVNMMSSKINVSVDLTERR